MTRTTAPGGNTSPQTSGASAWNRIDSELEDTLEAGRVRAGLYPAPVIPLRSRRHCVYCGGWTRGTACPSHRDLLQVDPYFSRETRTTTIPSSAGGPTPLAVVSHQNGHAGRPNFSVEFLSADNRQPRR